MGMFLRCFIIASLALASFPVFADEALVVRAVLDASVQALIEHGTPAELGAVASKLGWTVARLKETQIKTTDDIIERQLDPAARADVLRLVKYDKQLALANAQSMKNAFDTNGLAAKKGKQTSFVAADAKAAQSLKLDAEKNDVQTILDRMEKNDPAYAKTIATVREVIRTNPRVAYKDPGCDPSTFDINAQHVWLDLEASALGVDPADDVKVASNGLRVIGDETDRPELVDEEAALETLSDPEGCRLAGPAFRQGLIAIRNGAVH
jgi:hypothetical protein